MIKNIYEKLKLKREIIYDLLFIFLIVIIFYYPVFFQNKSLFPFAGGEVTRDWPEVRNFYASNQLVDKGASDWIEIPMIASFRNLIFDGEIPIWSSNNGFGNPVVPNSNGPVFFPLEIINIIFQGELSWSIFYLSRLFLGAIFLYFLLKDLCLSRLARFSGVLVLIFNGYVGCFLNIFFLNVDLMIPALLYFFNRISQNPSRKNLIFLSIAFGISILGGNPQPLLIGLSFCISFYFVRYFQKNKFSIINLWLSSKNIFLSLLIGFLLVSFFVFPFVELYKNSLTLRGFFGSLTGYPISLINLISSSYLWEIKEYGNALPWIGITPIFLIMISVLIKFKKRDRAIIIFLWIFLLLFFAKYFGLWPIQSIKNLPLAKEIIFTKYIFVIYIIFSFLVAYSIDNISYIKNSFKRVNLAILSFLSFLLLLFYFSILADGMNISDSDFYLKQENFYQLYIIIFVFILVTFSIFLIKNERLSKIIIFFAIAVELFLYIPNHSWPDRNHNAFKESDYIKFLKNNNTDKERIYGFGSLMMPNQSSYYNINDIRSLVPLKPERYWGFMNRFILKNDNMDFGFAAAKYFYLDSLPFLRVSNVGYIISEDSIGKIDSGKILGCKLLHGSSCSLHPNMIYPKKSSSKNNDSFLINDLEIKESQNQFEFYISMPEENWLPEKGDGVLVRVFKDNEDGVLLTEKIYDPKNNEQDRKRTKISIDLSNFNDQRINLFFKIFPEKTFSHDSTTLSNFSLEPKSLDVNLIYDRDVRIYKINNICSRYFLVPTENIIFSKDMKDSFDKLEIISQERSSLCNIAVVEREKFYDASIKLEDKRVKSKVIVLRDKSWRKEFDISTEASQFFIVTDLFYPGWKAKIDGKKVPIYPADGVFNSIEIPKGTHRVEIVYAPFSLILGLIISFLTAIFSIFFISIKFDKKSKKKKKRIRAFLSTPKSF